MAEYKIAPELRRCCWYGIVGAAALCGVCYWVTRFAQNRGPDEVAIRCGLFALGAAALMRVLRWRLLVDGQGITRWRLFRRDVWTWAYFGSGRIRKVHPCSFVDPNRPWWRRKLSLGYLAENDIQAVVAEINRHYRLPPPPEMRESLTIKYGFRCQATLSKNGIQLLTRGTPSVYLWHEIRSVHFTRMDPLRRDFRNLEIVLPDRTIELSLVTSQYGTNPTWRGATAEEISEFLLHYLAPEQVDTSIAGEPLKKRSHIEKKLKAAKSAKRQLGIMTAIWLLLFLGVFVWIAVDHGILKALVMAALGVLFIGPLYVVSYRANRRYIDDLESMLATVSDDA